MRERPLNIASWIRVGSALVVRRIRTMTWKQLDTRLSERLFKGFSMPLLMVAPYLRTNYWLHGDTFTFKRPFRRPVSMRIDEFDEIGVETTDQGPFVEDV